MRSAKDLKYWFREKCRGMGGLLKEDEDFNIDHCIIDDVDIALDYDLHTLEVKRKGVTVLSVEDVRDIPWFLSTIIPTEIYREQKRKNRRIMCVYAGTHRDEKDLVCINDKGEVVYALINIGASFRSY